jgi:hypothetical protein
MAKQIGMKTVLDEATMAWLEGHHIRPKDVRLWRAEGQVGDVTLLTLVVIVSDVDEIPPAQLVEIATDISPEELAEFRQRFEHSQKCPRPFGHAGECWPHGGTHPVVIP